MTVYKEDLPIFIAKKYSIFLAFYCHKRLRLVYQQIQNLLVWIQNDQETDIVVQTKYIMQD